jgi:acid phosphatase
MFRGRVLAAVAAVVVGAALLASGPPFDSDAAPPPPPAVGSQAGHFPRFGRVAVLMLENREYRDVIGSPQAPYLTRFAHSHALATGYYALGHPSLPNYLALTSGSTFGLSHDCNHCRFGTMTLFNQLDGAGISWKAYFESLPRTGFAGRKSGQYSKHLNPFVYYDGLSNDRSKVVPLGQLGGDLASGQLPRFLWISPDLLHDGHNGSVRASDRYVANLIPRVLGALGPRGVLFVAYDEGTTDAGAHGTRGGGHIPLIAAGPLARRGAVVRTTATQFSLLRTLEAGFNLPALGKAGSPSTPLLTGLLRR